MASSLSYAGGRIGLNDRQFAEVKEGLNEGDRVVLSSSVTGSDHHG